MDRLGAQTKRITVRSESYVIAICFTCTEALPEGSIVKLNSDGTVSRFTGGAGEIPLGSLEVGCIKANEEVTVRTQFVAESVAKATAAISGAGLLLSAGSATISTVLTHGYKPNAAGQWVIAMSLGAAALGDDFRVGIFRVSTLTPAAV